MRSHDRYKWAVEILGVKPYDHVLEIGCGAGFAVEQIVPLLKHGKVTAIDRSPLAIVKAIQRNVEFVRSGKAQFLKTDFLGFSQWGIAYDRIFCFNVNFFWTNKAIERECLLLRKLLAKKGLVYIFYGPIVGRGFEKTAQLVLENLDREQIKVLKNFYDERLRCCCIVAAL